MLSQTVRLMATIEEHSIIGGLGGAVAEALAEMPGPKPPLLRIGLREGFSCEVGDQEYLRKIYGLSTDSIAQRVYKAISKKNPEAKIYGVSN